MKSELDYYNLIEPEPLVLLTLITPEEDMISLSSFDLSIIFDVAFK